MATKTIGVLCKNNHLIFGRYKKVKSSFLMKCYIDEIVKDLVGVTNLHNNTDVFCPKYKIRIEGTAPVHDRPAVVINHGGVKRIKT
jgi:hypothetical protein